MDTFLKEIGKGNKIRADSHCTYIKSVIKKCATLIFIFAKHGDFSLSLYSKSPELRTPRIARNLSVIGR